MTTDHRNALRCAADRLDDAIVAREQAIVAARAANVPVTDIAQHVRLSRVHVHRILNAAGDSAPQ